MSLKICLIIGFVTLANLALTANIMEGAPVGTPSIVVECKNLPPEVSPTDIKAEGWLYVAGVLDRCTRRCVGWAMDDTLATTLPLAALDMALKQRQPTAGLVYHSDRGVQYASQAYRQRLAQAGVIPSMSRPGNCCDNAAMESFWSSLKRELVHRCQFATRAEARAAIFEWIEAFYNRERLHSALGYQSPVDFETNLN